MATEIERKFLPKDPDWRPPGQAERLVQGYFWLNENATAHIARGPKDAFILVLRPRDAAEWRYRLPATDGAELLAHNPHYLSRKWTLRVRHADKKGGFLTLKGPASDDRTTRAEYEYPLKPGETKALLALCPNTHISKDRYYIPYKGLTWDVDVYDGHLRGLVTCEVELPRADAKFALPPWVGTEVTQLKGYTNAALARSRIVPKLKD